MTEYSPSGSRTKVLRSLAVICILLLSLVCLNMGFVQNAEGLDPFVIKGYCYENNGTKIPSITVTLLNTRTGDSTNVSANSTGWYSYNLLNFPNGWMYGDIIQGNITNSTGSTGSNSTQLKVGTTSKQMDIWIGLETRVSGVEFYIIDQDGYPIEGALINIKNSDGDIVTTKMSDSNGKASCDLADGVYTVTVSKSGYNDVVKKIRVHGSNTYTIRLGEAEEDEVTISNFWFWVMLAFALIGVLASMMYLAKRL